MPVASAYPHARWPRVRRADLAWLRAVLRGLPWEGVEAAHAEAAALLGTPARLLPGVPERLSAEAACAALGSPLLAIALQWRAGARVLPLLCELPPELGALLVDRVLGGEGLPAHPPGGALPAFSAGVLGYLAARVAAAAGGELRVQGPLDDPARAAALLGSAPVLAWPLALELDGRRRGTLHVLLPEPSAQALAGAPPRARPLLSQSLQALPVRLCAHAARVTLTRAELAALAPGDVVVPDRCRLARSGDGFAGQVALHAIGARDERWIGSARGDEITLERLQAEGETIMTEGKRIEATGAGAGEVVPAVPAEAPVELCLELARFTLPLGELAALRPGEVLCTGRAIGEIALLSAGGRALARGELVEVEGEIGIRIRELMP